MPQHVDPPGRAAEQGAEGTTLFWTLTNSIMSMVIQFQSHLEREHS